MSDDPLTTQTVPRRRRTSSLLGALLALLLVGGLLGAPEASAGRSWCKIDPLFRVGDDIVDVSLASTKEMWSSATGPIKLVLTTPKGVNVEALRVDDGFGHGYEIRYATSSRLVDNDKLTEIAVAVYAPAGDRTLPVRVDVFSTSGSTRIASVTVEGTANDWITATAT